MASPRRSGLRDFHHTAARLTLDLQTLVAQHDHEVASLREENLRLKRGGGEDGLEQGASEADKWSPRSGGSQASGHGRDSQPLPAGHKSRGRTGAVVTILDEQTGVVGSPRTSVPRPASPANAAGDPEAGERQKPSGARPSPRKAVASEVPSFAAEAAAGDVGPEPLGRMAFCQEPVVRVDSNPEHVGRTHSSSRSSANVMSLDWSSCGSSPSSASVAQEPPPQHLALEGPEKQRRHPEKREQESFSSRAAKTVQDHLRFRNQPTKSGTLQNLQAAETSRLTRMVRSKEFEMVFSLFIVLNCATMGLEAEFLVNGGSDWMETSLEISEHVFTLLFFVELLLRIKVYGWRSFLPTSSSNVWNFLDAMLVLVTGVIFGWIWKLVIRLSGASESTDGTLRLLTVLRAFRLIRLARVVRNVELFNEVWLLIRGLSNSVRTLFWTCMVIFIIAYTFAIFGLATISKEFVRQSQAAVPDSPEQRELHDLVRYTGSLDRLLFTLVQLLTTDNWSDVVRLSVKYTVWSWMYYYTYIGIVVIVLMNLVTAIIVENALMTSKMDEDKQLASKEKTRSHELKKLNQIFLMMDQDGDGLLSWQEFESAFQQEDILNKWKLLDFQPDECRDLFKLLDRGDGCIQLTDFYDGLSRMKGSAQSKDLFQIMKSLEDLSTVVSELVYLQDPQSASRSSTGSRTTRHAVRHQVGASGQIVA